MHRPATARHVLPEFTERTGDGTRTFDPYSKLLSERIVMLGTPVDDTAANDVIAQLTHLEHAAPERSISLYINSPGGSFPALSAVYDTMRFITCDIETVCLGQAGAAAAVLCAAGTPGLRLALPHARFVVHEPGLPEPVQGQPSDLALHAGELQRHRDSMVAMLALHTGQSEERIRRDTDRTTVFDAVGAVAYGLVDHVVVNRGRQSARPGAR
ncbi:ATP-dependent Clp protease proteolytic subunit [Streptomyces morookaense]|uniref:ATP-dependent Clp protease proteolytic subunit n=1 Tax=Streptomyces morookaense TaxID=1970 RepID=A0A7Y7E630_STRMO|nr:ATP-dependent Clp protease proteolytic subunit [Streptomyces morookaense]NVK77445.1 ATP-dependent Clp protease proteolytic subunit [Streptomyces morookaense]GHF21808.1 putative ATP-dependent Clp protease proteolytic subunit-like protein [Streptomyces morookaense]